MWCTLRWPSSFCLLLPPLEALSPTLNFCCLIRVWKSYNWWQVPVPEGLPMNLWFLGGLLSPGRMRPGLPVYLWILNCPPLPGRMPGLLMCFLILSPSFLPLTELASEILLEVFEFSLFSSGVETFHNQSMWYWPSLNSILKLNDLMALSSAVTCGESLIPMTFRSQYSWTSIIGTPRKQKNRANYQIVPIMRSLYHVNMAPWSPRNRATYQIVP